MNKDPFYVPFRLFKTVNEMLYSRGYFVERQNENLEMNMAAFKERFPDINVDHSTMIIKATPLRPDDDRLSGNLTVHFLGEDKIKLESLRNIVSDLAKAEVYHAIVVGTGINKRMKEYLDNLQRESTPIRVEAFEYEELIINITKHELVPHHEILSKTEKEQLLDRYKVTENQLPRINVADPVARFLGARRGDVIKIVRKSPTAGRYVTYRYVV